MCMRGLPGGGGGSEGSVKIRKNRYKIEKDGPQSSSILSTVTWKDKNIEVAQGSRSQGGCSGKAENKAVQPNPNRKQNFT